MKRNLQRLIICFLFFIFWLDGKEATGQWVTIPDTNFVNWLNTHGYASCMNGNLMDTTCNLVTTTITIKCKNSNIQNLEGIQYFDNLDSLICFSNPLTYLPSFPLSLKYLSCYSASLTSLPSLPYQLNYLDCSSNQLTSLPALYPPLNYLNCSSNQLTSLNVLSDSLKYLYCSSNQLTVLPTIPSKLIYLYCSYNLLTSIPVLPYQTVTKLYCDHNQLTNIAYPLPKWLTDLHCDYNQLTSLPALTYNNSLFYVSCSNNLLTTLPSFTYTSAYYLDVSHNQLTSITNSLHDLMQFNCSYNLLDTLPYVHLTSGSLNCSHNLLTTLGNPNWISSDNFVDCSYNQLTSIPAIRNVAGSGIKSLLCNNNNLSSLPDLPTTMYNLNANNNPNLTCLPKLTTIIYQLQFNNTAVQCLPNYGTVGSSNPPLSSIPICDFFSNNGCDYWWNINGKVYTDNNFNCLPDANEIKLSNIKLNLFQNGILEQQTCTGGEGLYSFEADTGSYTYIIDTVDLPIIVSCPSNGFQFSVISPTNLADDNMNFGVNCKTGFDIGINAIVRTSGEFRPAHYATVNFKAGDISNYYGLHCSNGITGTVTVIINGPATYISPANGSLTPIVNGDTLSYSITDFGAVNFNSDFTIVIQTDTTAVIGDTICFNVNITPAIGDNNTSNNNLQHCFQVVNSYDPNEKEVYPINNIVLPDNKLTYTIHYQNTGTTSAENICIVDTLDANIDASTFKLLAYDHEALIQIKDNVVQFIFKHINLPDSTTNEPDSHGYIQFSAQLKDSLTIPIGGTVHNTSYIYFDFNTPVQTNEIVDTLQINCNSFAAINYHNKKFCCGDTIVAVASLSYPSNVEWYVDSVFVSDNQIVAIPNLSTGSHQIKLIASNPYCTQQFISNVFVNALPTINLGNDITACPNIIDAGIGYSSYLWSSAASTQSIYAFSPGNYSVIVTDSFGCANSDTINITFNALPPINLGNDTTLCTPLMLDAGGNHLSYSWSNGSTAQIANVSSSGTYSVIVTDSVGCANADTINLIFNPIPFLNLNSIKASCGPITGLSAGTGYTSYLWSTGQTTQSITVTMIGSYSVVVTNNYGCSTADSINVILNAIPLINLGVDTATCGIPIVLEATAGDSLYLWNTGSTSQMITASTTGTYTVTVTNSYGCTKSDAIHLAINPLPYVNLGNDTATCNLPVVLNSGLNGATYLWSNGKSTKKITVHNSGTYSVLVTDSNGCSNADTVAIIINPLPAKPTITQNINLLTSSSSTGNQWLKNGNIITGATNSTYIVAFTGWYNVQVTDSNGCSNVSDSIFMDLTGVNNIGNPHGDIYLIPNPANSSFVVSGLAFWVGDVITITDAIGKIVYQMQVTQPTSNLKLQISNQESGIYFVNIKTSKFSEVLKLVKE